MIKVKVAVSGYVSGTWVDYSGVSNVKIHNSHADLNKIYIYWNIEMVYLKTYLINHNRNPDIMR